MLKYRVIPILLVILILSFQLRVHAQWVEQTISLKPGWNAVYLEVEPQPNQCDEVFSDLPIESVWTWNSTVSSVEYIQNPDTLVPKHPQWMVYFPSASPQGFLTNLFILMGGRAYLINLKGEQTINWTILGRPSLPKIQWRADSFNFVGFHLSPGEEPFFASFFSSSPAHAGQEIYRLNAEDVWEKIEHPAITTLQQGEAYWVYCKGHSDYTGPLACQVEQGNGLDYGKTLVEQEFRIRNLSSSQATVSLSTLPSANPTDPSQPPVAGDVPLSYWRFEPQINEAGWTPFPETLSLTISSGQEKTLRLAVKRSTMPPTGLCQSILKVTNEKGMYILVPIRAKGSGQNTENLLTRKKIRFKDADTQRYAGLWVGRAVIRQVSQPADPANPNTPKPTSTEFQFPLIVHLDAEGQARLLREVIQMWADGTWKEDPNDPGKQIVDQPGHFVLLTDDSLVSQYSGAGIRGGEPVGRRISSAAFSFPGPVDMNGSFSATGSLTCSLAIEPDDPLNPFKHNYHPDHDNLDELRQNYKEEAYRVSRKIELVFTDFDPLVPEEAQAQSWGDTGMGGIYREVVSGLHRENIYVKGNFYLHRVCPVAVLNDGR